MSKEFSEVDFQNVELDDMMGRGSGIRQLLKRNEFAKMLLKGWHKS